MGGPPKEIAVTIIQLVADAQDTPVETLPPLANTIDPDALDTLVTNEPSGDVTVAFTYAGRHVIVQSGKTVYVRPVNGEREGWSDKAYFGE